MSNQGRINNWRARRRADGYEIGAGMSREAAASSSTPTAPATTLDHILAALRRSPRETPVQRRQVYEALQARLDSDTFGADDETLDLLRRRLRTAIRLVEQDIRAGVDVFAPGYAPATLARDEAHLADAHEKRVRRRREEEARDARRHASRQDRALTSELAAGEANDLATLRANIASLHATQRLRTTKAGRSNVCALLPMLVLQLHTIQGESRFALAWALFGPAVLLSLISSLYLLTGTQFILGMDVPTFSLLGATTWIMFRQIIFRSSTSYISARGLLNLQGITPLLCASVQAVLYQAIFVLVFATLIVVGHAFDLISLPTSWPAFLVYVIAMGFGGASMGVLFGAIASKWRFFLRLATAIERLLEIFSSVFFVSEQLPEQYRAWFLWSPFAHGMQLLRSAYFESYRSTDARLSYFVTSLVLLAGVALCADRFARCNVQPM
ncbi:Sugar ABC transporter permease [Burkholderia sp. 8Y]|uniref:ABC transporter permease n=1 Tax=Burkholderia sp. 8Y TaxID=2653133 RepID=UPI0012F4232D|nr:sugar ABC transporter permease [Burkholderia sp. 8Y]VXB02349.1 Sugar ABC transporter permease [Burkholderia sp. 8Y]